MERVKKPRPRKARLSSVANAILLTKAFSEDEFELGISALAARLGLAKSTVHRLASTLVQYDILEQNRDSGRYRPGLALFELGALVRPGLREVVTSTKGVTFWESDARAKSELGYSSRALEAGYVTTVQ